MGPASPDEPPRQTHHVQSFSTAATSFAPNNASFKGAAEEARTHALSQGHDPDSFYEQEIVWGDMDSFRCLLC